MGDSTKEWEIYKGLNRKFVLMWLFYVPVCIATFAVSVIIFGKGAPAAFIVTAVVGFIWVGFFLSLAARLRGWKCPRCQGVFHSRWKGVFTARCANCGLQKYS
jgi:threonine/homoserine/homoserine lactone efflux protein